MPNRLYDPNGNIHDDRMEDALDNALHEHKIHGIQSEGRIHKFTEALQEQLKEHRGQIGTKYTKNEIKRIIHHMESNRTDGFTRDQIREFEKILEDKKFDIE